MRALLEEYGYVLDFKNNIWISPNYEGIAYNDGDEIETRIASIIQKTSDISVLSTELRPHCTDWPSLYHLSGTRSNVMRPFESFIKGDVLEIGAGCGAITRYLGECGANVLALEGSPRRAAIARSRTRDLDNVTVLAEKFDQFQCDHQFDVVTLIGVFEYANLFTSGDNPQRIMLERVHALLKPNGKLIIAIENQLGLKYFAGAPEDHLGQPMLGIEGRYQKDQPQTFGRAVLKNMLEQAAFSTSEFLAPFPDYKLPVSIVTEEGFSNKNFDAAAFAWASSRRDPQLPVYCNFSLELAWPEIFENGLGLDVANSFLIIASPSAKQFISTDVLAYHYSVDRIPEYCKETLFIARDDGDIRVDYRRLGKFDASVDKENKLPIKFICPESDKYVLGKPLSYEFIRVVTKEDWSFDQVARFVSRYLSIVGTFAKSAGLQMSTTSPYAELDGDFFDVIPQNIIILDNGEPAFIDKEWQLASSIELGHLLFRSLLSLTSLVTRFGRPASQASMTLYQFMDGVFTAAGLKLQEKDYARYTALEADIQYSVTGRKLEGFLTWGDGRLQTLNLSQVLTQRDAEIAEKNKQLVNTQRDSEFAEKNKQLVNMQHIVNQLERQVSTLNIETVKRGEWALDLGRQLKEVQAETSRLTSSHSWKITMPLREGRRWLMRPAAQAKRYAKVAIRAGKLVYLRLPISTETRAAHRILLEKYAPRVLLVSATPLVPTAPLQPRAVVGTPYSEFDLSVSRIELRTSPAPVVSVIVPIYGKSNYTLRCLASIAAHPPALAFEIIVVDDCSPDDSANILRGIDGIRLISNQQNQGFIRSCNIGAKAANGQYLCFLNNDTEVTPDWLDELLRTFRDFPGTGLVGSKLVYPDGSLQEAGGIIWKDGSAWNFGRNQDQLLPMYNYAREVDYCSGASIMLAKSLFEELGGFDEHYLPAYCEDSDLALKIRDRGYRVIYQPLSVVVHYEGITSGTDTGQGAKAYQVANLQKQFQRWQKRLENHQANGVDVDDAKDRMAKRRVLVLDHCTPTPDQDAGSVITFNLLLLLREMGFQVTFIAENNFLYMPDYTPALQRAGIEVLYTPYCNSVRQHIMEVGARYDLVLMFRPMVIVHHLDGVRRWCPQAKVLFHTVDLHYLRMSREASLLGDVSKQEASEQMKKIEFDSIRGADASIVVSMTEQEILHRELPDQKIHVFPLIMEVNGTSKTFDDRCDIVFVGGYQHVPNVDAVVYFVTEIMPILRERLPGVRFYAVGSNVPAEIEALAAEDVIITGFVEDLAPLLDRMRVSVAPLRFGAGIKGKIGTSMAAGLPAVATPLAAEGMSLTAGKNILVADGAQAFAEAVVQLYQSESLWKQISDAGIAFAESAWGGEAAWTTLESILHDLDLDVERHARPLTLWGNKPDAAADHQGTV